MTSLSIAGRCVDCGAEIAQQQGGGRPRKRCHSCSPPKRRPRIVVEKACIECGSSFIARSATNSFCSERCRYKHRDRAISRDKWLRSPKAPCGKCGGPSGRKPSDVERKRIELGDPDWNPTCQKCLGIGLEDVCGTSTGFNRHRSRGEEPCEPCRIAWNDYCIEKRRRRHELTGERRSSWSTIIPISHRDRMAIYERDGWVCQLCGDPVDPELKGNDRWAATLDHVVPRSMTLFPDDSPENLRLAHRSCNSKRGARVRLEEKRRRVAAQDGASAGNVPSSIHQPAGDR